MKVAGELQDALKPVPEAEPDLVLVQHRTVAEGQLGVILLDPEHIKVNSGSSYWILNI